MPEQAEVRLQFTNGDKILYWSDFTFRDDFLDPLGSFSFTVRPPLSERKRYDGLLEKGALVGLKVNGQPQASMLITTRSRTSSKKGGVFNIDCKSVLVTPYEGSVDYTVNKSVKDDKPVSEVILEVMGHYGFTEILVDQELDVQVRSGKSLPGREPSGLVLEELKERDLEASPGETAYQFCSRVFSRLGVVLRASYDGKLLLMKPNYSGENVATIVEGIRGLPGAVRPHGDVTISETNDGQYSEVVILGRKLDDVGATLTGKPIGRVVWKGGTARSGTPFQNVKTKQLDFEGDGLPPWAYQSEEESVYKPKIILAKKCRDQERCERFAEYVIGNNAANAYTVACNVQGLVPPSGFIWNIGQNVRFLSHTWNIDRQMWILGKTFRGDPDQGYLTELKLIPRGALQLGESP